jgi:hypothetical protein
MRFRSNRTEVISAKISNPNKKRLDIAVIKLGLASRNEAMNQAIDFWLRLVEEDKITMKIEPKPEPNE